MAIPFLVEKGAERRRKASVAEGAGAQQAEERGEYEVHRKVAEDAEEQTRFCDLPRGPGSYALLSNCADAACERSN